MKSLRLVVALPLVGALAAAGCGGDDTATEVVAARLAINVGRTTDPVSQLLAEIYGQGLENAGYPVGRKDAVADRAAAIAGLEAGRLQFVPDLSASLLAHVADAAGTDNVAVTVEDQLGALKATLPATLIAGPVTAAEATTVVSCGAATVAEHAVTTISELAAVADEIVLGGDASFETAEAFGLAALDEAYATTFSYVAVDTDDVSTSLAAGTIDCLVAPRTLAAITIDGLLVLGDDKNVVPLDMVIPVMTVAAATPDVVSVVTQLNTSLTTEVLRALLVKVSVGDVSYDVVAKQFLASLGSGQ